MEKTKKRSKVFSKWIRRNCPAANTGFCVSDLDWILWDYRQRKLMLLEEKTKMGEVSTWFMRFLMEVLHPALTQFCMENDITYYGIHLVQFVNDGPRDNEIILDGRYISEEELINFLSMKDAPQAIKEDAQE